MAATEGEQVLIWHEETATSKKVKSKHTALGRRNQELLHQKWDQWTSTGVYALESIQEKAAAAPGSPVIQIYFWSSANCKEMGRKKKVYRIKGQVRIKWVFFRWKAQHGECCKTYPTFHLKNNKNWKTHELRLWKRWVAGITEKSSYSRKIWQVRTLQISK